MSNEKIKGTNLSIPLTDEETKKLEKIKEQLKEKVSTKAIKRLLSIYFRYLEQIDEISKLKAKVRTLESDIVDKEMEIQSIKKKVSSYLSAYNDIKKIVE